MAENSKIEWTDHTFNSWEGCQKVGPGCDNCYAEARNARFAGGTAANWGPGAPRRRTSESNWRKPLQWNAAHATFFAAHGRRQRVFCASLADVFDNEVPAEWRADLFRLIAETPNLDWLLLTKRIGNAARMIAEAQCDLPPVSKWSAWPLPNVWLGATIVNQAEADRDIPKLLATPARVRFLSCEPLLGPVDLTRLHFPASASSDPGTEFTCNALTGSAVMTNKGVPIMDASAEDERIDWVIVGGESGPGARPMHPDWARSLRDQCKAAGVPFLFKQWGEWASTWHARIDPELAVGKPYVHVTPMCRENGSNMSAPNYQLDKVGKKAAGRLLDGVEHNGFPEVACSK